MHYFVSILCVYSSFSIILERKKNLVALLLLPYRCIVTLNVFYYKCSVALHGAGSWYAVCDCGIF